MALCAFFVAVAVAVSGCGSSIPSGAVASVAGNPISKRAVDHWMYLVDKGQSAQSPGAPVIVPNDPPQFAKCISQARTAYPTLKKETDSQVRTTCKTLFTQLVGQAMGYLIPAYWYQAEAHKQGLTVSDAAVAKQLTAEKKQNGIKTGAQFQALLKEQGLTQADIEYEIRTSLVLKKLEAKHPATVTSADISSYYNQHKSSFGHPQSRNLREVLATSRAKAQAAIAALKSGQSWGVVAKKYSTDPTSKNKGGLLPGVTQGSQDASLTKAAFAAPLNHVVGPVKAQFGWYVVQVIKIIPATQEPLAKATPQIRSTLTSTKAQAAQTAVTDQVKKAYGSTTLCTKTYSVANCKGYKAPKTSTSAAPPASGSTATAPSGATATAPSSATATTSATSSH